MASTGRGKWLRTELVEVHICYLLSAIKVKNGTLLYTKIIRIHVNKGIEIAYPISSGEEFCVYILECADKSFYVGFSDDVVKRLLRHNKGEGAEYTRKRLPVKLIYCEVFNERCDALKREKQLKGWSRKKKVALICKNLAG